MPKESVKNFKPLNMGEAKISLLRDFKRDPISLKHDAEVLKFLAEETVLKKATPTLKSLNLAKRIKTITMKDKSKKDPFASYR